MSVRKIRSSWWVDFRFGGIRYRKRSPENTAAGAKAYEALLRQRLTTGASIAPAGPNPETPTFRDFAEEWMRTWVRANNKPSTMKCKMTMLRVYLIPAFGDSRLDEVTTRAVEHFKAERLGAGSSAQTMNNVLTTLSGCLRQAVEWGIIASAPRIRWLRAPRMPASFLSPDEVRRLLDAAGNGRWRDMIVVALHTGLRFGELAALDWSDVHLSARRLTVRRNISAGEISSPKNDRARHVPISETLHAELARRRRASGLLFPTASGRPVDNGSANDAIRRIARRAGLSPIHWHTLRHTFASHLVAGGVPLPAVQQLLGHATITMTMRYAHVAPSALRAAVAVFDGLGPMHDLGQPVGNTPAPNVPSSPALTLPICAQQSEGTGPAR